ncbi:MULTISPECIES: hypothetical protein [Aquitalea]|jgi:hypothetical protein|uniref:hypothetical protein n=1 Tax=Aquitalea TaxID=407217 RepID=UPI00135C6BB2|nr:MULTISPECIES: hypothetical protein [Aquitalea]
MSTISGVSTVARTPTAYSVLRQGAKNVVDELGSAAKAAGGGLSGGVSATGTAAAHGLTAVGESLSTLGRTINTYV